MAETIYGLCAVIALICCLQLFRAYFRRRYRLLLWSSLCFAGLTLNNMLLVADKIFFPDVDLAVWRLLIALVSLTVLLYGLIWDTA